MNTKIGKATIYLSDIQIPESPSIDTLQIEAENILIDGDTGAVVETGRASFQIAFLESELNQYFAGFDEDNLSDICIKFLTGSIHLSGKRRMLGLANLRFELDGTISHSGTSQLKVKLTTIRLAKLISLPESLLNNLSTRLSEALNSGLNNVPCLMIESITDINIVPGRISISGTISQSTIINPFDYKNGVVSQTSAPDSLSLGNNQNPMISA